jgi:acyl-CoA synthetase (AMP-forming)/AMP-acid ligase II
MNFLLSKIDENGEKIALIYQDQFYKYSDFKVQINKYYLEIKNSIKNGEVVSIISGWSYFSISLFFALTKNKNILVPISTDVAGEIKSKIKEGFVNKIIEITEDGKLIITNTLLKKSHPLISKLKKTEQS